MANPKHVEQLKSSVNEWNQWRQEQPEAHPDLSSVDLSDANLIGVNFISVNLSGANLSNAKLIRTDFSDANLSSSDLSDANLSNADLSFVNLSNADLSNADLSNADLSNADLSNADLSDANLSNADLSDANLIRTDLSSANLIRTDLSNTNLSSSDLSNANLTEAHFFHTVFAWVDLSNVKGLEGTIHNGPSSVDTKSVTLPHNEHIRRHFLRNTGFPDTFIEYLSSLLTTSTQQYHSLFLSHSHHDQEFTRRLYTDLQDRGTRCWYAPHDLLSGRPMVRDIEEVIHLHEKLLLILSEHVVSSSWVELEVEAALYKEAITGQKILFPIRLDNTILESDTIWAKRLRQRFIADFTDFHDEDSYQQALDTLLRHLKVAKQPVK